MTPQRTNGLLPTAWPPRRRRARRVMTAKQPCPRRTPPSPYVVPHPVLERQKATTHVLTTRMQAKMHGNEPSKGAKIDEELREEEQATLKKKGGDSLPGKK